MNKQSNGAHLEFMIGLPLLQICIGNNELILNFDKQVSITIESQLIYQDKNGGRTECDTLITALNIIHPLLSNSVAYAVIEPSGTLIVTFDVGETIEVFRDSQIFENYQVKFGNRVFVV